MMEEFDSWNSDESNVLSLDTSDNVNNTNTKSRILSSYPVKCVLLGNSGVGKTTLCRLFATNQLDNKVTSTIGVGFASKTINLILDDGSYQEIVVQLWDTAGSPRFHNIIKSYLRGVFIAFFLVDLTDRRSFDDLDLWKERLDDMVEDENTKDSGKLIIPIPVIIATKVDCKGHQVSAMELDAKARQWHCKNYILSNMHSNAATNIYRIFYMSLEELHNKFIKYESKGAILPDIILKKGLKDYINLDSDTTNNKFKCCY